MMQRHQRADHAVQRGERVADADVHAHRRTVRKTGDVAHAAHRFADRAETGLVAVRPGLAEAGQAHHDQSRVGRRERVVAEAPLLERARAEILDHDVGIRARAAARSPALRASAGRRSPTSCCAPGRTTTATCLRAAAATGAADRRPGRAARSGRLDLDRPRRRTPRTPCPRTARRRLQLAPARRTLQSAGAAKAGRSAPWRCGAHTRWNCRRDARAAPPRASAASPPSASPTKICGFEG